MIADSNMAVNLSKNRLALLTAYQDVINETSSTDWALYTYEGNSNDLILASSGDGGLQEITVTFDNSRVMYGFCSLKDPSAALPRYILINWVGEDVPDARKCTCASHVATIADFFQGVDVIINASSMEDIDPSAIGQRLTNGTAPVASPVLGRLRIRDEEQGEHVGTVYHKTNAEIEMKKINREEFWEQAKREEELRKDEERKKMAEERQRFEEERMQLEKKEQEDREKRYRERERQIEEHRSETEASGKKMQEEEEARERTRNQPTIAADPSYEDPSLEKKESEVEEAKAIIAQRSGNPREFFKLKEKAVSCCVDSTVSPVSIHRTDDDDEASLDRGMAAVSPIPKIVTTPIQEDKEEDRNEWGCEPKQRAPVQESTPTKPVQSVAPRARDSAHGDDDSFSGVRVPGQQERDSLVDLWDGGPTPGPAPSQSSQIRDTMGGAGARPSDPPPPRPQPLLSFDEMGDAALCGGPGGPEEDPSSLVDLDGSHQMTLSYQHALQHASDDGQLLMTNGEAMLKEGTQASEGYFSQSQEEDFDGSAKPTPVFYNKPPEIDITCWDTDPVMDDDD
ncbi:drebrin [Osmerus mordax]|uniref:drebrin n=1 Tax=Osmerus mordax TaxID=8014 RepID=UPI00351077B8